MLVGIPLEREFLTSLTPSTSAMAEVAAAHNDPPYPWVGQTANLRTVPFL